MYPCNCGREFKSKSSLRSHARFCEKYEASPKKQSSYKIEENLYRCECEKKFTNHQSLNAHFSHCLIHRRGKPEIREHVVFKKMSGWDKLSKDEINEIRKRAGNTYSENIKDGKYSASFTGKNHTKEAKEKLSISNNGRNNGYVKTKYYEVFCPSENKFIKVQGTWELKYANYLNENNIKWTRSRSISLKYKLFKDDYWHTYYPDFYLIDTEEYVEIKGYWWKSKDGRVDDRRKMKMVKLHNPKRKIIEKIKKL